MRRLTPRKIRGYALPDAPRINRGNTSLIYETADPCVLEVFTIEQLKLDWWQHGLGIISEYDEVCSAHYEGYERHYYGGQFKRCELKHYDLPVYRCLVRRLAAPNREQARRIRQIQRTINNTHFVWNTNQPTYFIQRWEKLASLNIPEIAPCIDFIADYDLQNVYPDFGNGDFMVLDGAIVCLDPFHHRDLQPAFRLTD